MLTCHYCGNADENVLRDEGEHQLSPGAQRARGRNADRYGVHRWDPDAEETECPPDIEGWKTCDGCTGLFPMDTLFRALVRFQDDPDAPPDLQQYCPACRKAYVVGAGS